MHPVKNVTHAYWIPCMTGSGWRLKRKFGTFHQKWKFTIRSDKSNWERHETHDWKSVFCQIFLIARLLYFLEIYSGILYTDIWTNNKLPFILNGVSSKQCYLIKLYHIKFKKVWNILKLKFHSKHKFQQIVILFTVQRK